MAGPGPRRLYVVGDVHGHLEAITGHLAAAGLVGHGSSWTGGRGHLIFLGDLVDRGPDGAGVIDLVRRLESEAAAAGGAVIALMGNHDLKLLAAHRFGDSPWPPGPTTTFRAAWRTFGEERDLAGLDAEAADWLARRPAMATIGDYVLVHADAAVYAHHGSTVAAVNRSMAAVVASTDPRGWAELLVAFDEHGAFEVPGAADAFLARFGGRVVVHGHTPIAKATGRPARAVTGAHSYAGGRCLNVDGGLYLGGPGFVTLLPAQVATGIGPGAPREVP